MNTLPDTWTYFYAGYAVILFSIIGYAVSLFVRWQRGMARQDHRRKQKK